MTKREAYLRALANNQVDLLTWAPNLDYWLLVNRAEGTLPAKYEGMSRNEIILAIGGTIWNRSVGLKTVYDKSIILKSWAEGSQQIDEFHTPVGVIRQVNRVADGAYRSPFLAEHYVKDVDSIRILKYVVEGTHYEADFGPTYQAIMETGDHGIVLNSYFCVPFIEFAKTASGYANAFYLWMDHRDEVDALIDAYSQSFIQGYQVLADGPADVIATGDNMDGTMISPNIFKEYAIPFYSEAQKVVSAKGKIFEGHWCGRTQTLLPLVPGCGLDVVEAIVTKPMADIELSQALEMLNGEVVLQGGIPSVLVCEEGCSRQEFEEYIENVILPLQGRSGFILGMSDNVPPNADFSRIEAVADLIGSTTAHESLKKADRPEDLVPA